MSINLKGRIDSKNAAQVESEIKAQLPEDKNTTVILDMKNLEYISSAGLRVILRIKKEYPDLQITGVNSEVYEILDMTGFTQMMAVEKAYRKVSIEGCEEIGRGANGTIYRIDSDNVVKVYNNADALADIRNEREVSKLALILGIPTAISYDVVKVGESYGAVFELLNAKSFSNILSSEPEKIDWCVDEFVSMLKKIHSTVVPEGKLPDMKEVAVSWAEFILDYLPEKEGKKLLSLIKAIPEDNHMIHGDYHTKNLELTNNEVLLIDMDTLSVGNPIFELASIYNAYAGYSEYNHEVFNKFQGFDRSLGTEFLHKAISKYLGTNCETKIEEVLDKARIIGYTRLIRRSIRRNGLENESGKAEIELWKSELTELINKTDTLLFNFNELTIEAKKENLSEVQQFVEERLEKVKCDFKSVMQIGIAVEEIFINISNYAYAPDEGYATVKVETEENPAIVSITFIDRGIPYNPLSKVDPDITLSAEGREIGGLGIFMTKKIMDNVSYEYNDGKNILTLTKKI